MCIRIYIGEPTVTKHSHSDCLLLIPIIVFVQIEQFVRHVCI